MNLQGIQLTWLGHATSRIQTPEGKTLYIDPWIAAGTPGELQKLVPGSEVLELEPGKTISQTTTSS